jgi:uncharacterized protein (DUF362 family)
MSKVAITREQRIEQAIDSALKLLDIESLIRNKVVAIKPNETWASKEDTTAVTQPDTLRAVIRFAKQFKPKQLVVSGGAGASETDDALRVSGMMQVIEEEQVDFFDHNRPPFREVSLEYAPDKDVDGPQKSIMVNPRVLEYDTLISLAQLKVHQTATVTLSLKNIAMSYPAADYYGHPRWKQKKPNHFFADMHSFIAAMAKRFPPQLAIIAAHPALIGLGPIGGYPVHAGMIVASKDPLAADVVGAQLLGFNTQGVRHLWEAQRLGVGEGDIEKIQLAGMGMEEAFQAFTRAAYGKPLSLDQA